MDNTFTSGDWRIYESEKIYTGELHYSRRDSIYIDIFLDDSDDCESSFDMYDVIPFISGTASFGLKITLIGCRITQTSFYNSRYTIGFNVNYMIKDFHALKEDDIKFHQINLSIPGMLGWGNISNFIRNDVQNPNQILELFTKEPISIFTCKEYDLLYFLSYDFPDNLLKEEITLTQTPYIQIKSSINQSIDWFINIAERMKRLIEVAIGATLSFDIITILPKEISDESMQTLHHSKPLLVTHKLNRKMSNDYFYERYTEHDYLFDLSDLKTLCLSNWQELSNKMEPIFELYLDSVYNKSHSMSRHFLNMVQALETYHSRRIASTKEDYLSRIEKITSQLPEDVRQSNKEYLLRGLRKDITLHNRISDLLTAEFKFDFSIAPYNKRDFTKSVVITRNYYIHYSEKLEHQAFKDNDLIRAFIILRNVLEYYILKEINIDEDLLKQKVNHRVNMLP